MLKITDMSNIELSRIIEARGLKITELGKVLYPNSNYPYLAIRRVLQGISLLSSEQVAILSEFTKIPIGFLYNMKKWDLHLSDQKIHAVADGVRAELNTDTWESQIYVEGQALHKPFKVVPGIGLKDYLDHVTELVIKHKQ